MIETRRETFETPDGSVPVFDWNDKTEIAIKKVLREGEHYPSMTVVYKMIGLDNLGVPNLDGGVQKNKAKKCLSMYARLEKVQKGKNEVCCYEIYPIPRFVVNPDGRGKNGIYIDRLIPIMLSLFNACTDSQIETTINKLAVNFSLVKAKYAYIHQPETYEDLFQANEKYTASMINQFYTRSQKILQRVIYTALDRLQNKMRVISYTKEHIIISSDNTMHVATPDESKWIEEAENVALEEFDAHSKFTIQSGKRKASYYNWVIAYINDQHKVSWDEYYQEIHITIHKNAINDAYDAQSSQDLMRYRKELREHFANAVFSATQNSYNTNQAKAEKKIATKANELCSLSTEVNELTVLGMDYSNEFQRYAIKELRKEKKLYKYHPTYIPVQKGLIEYFIGNIDEKG